MGSHGYVPVFVIYQLSCATRSRKSRAPFVTRANSRGGEWASISEITSLRLALHRLLFRNSPGRPPTQLLFDRYNPRGFSTHKLCSHSSAITSTRYRARSSEYPRLEIFAFIVASNAVDTPNGPLISSSNVGGGCGDVSLRRGDTTFSGREGVTRGARITALLYKNARRNRRDSGELC